MEQANCQAFESSSGGSDEEDAIKAALKEINMETYETSRVSPNNCTVL